MTEETTENNREQENSDTENNASGNSSENASGNNSQNSSDIDAGSYESEDSAPEETVESLKQALVAAELKVRDEALRAQAEIQNVRRRAERDVESAHKFGQEKLAKELLAVVDSLERGVQTIDEQGIELDSAVKVIIDGSNLTLKLLTDTLAKFQIKQINPVGEPFDPLFHSAVSVIPSPDAEPNSVIAVVQKGYTLHDRLLRPAMVVVSKS